MTITKSINEDSATLAVSGRVDTTNSAVFQQKLSNEIENCTKLILDCSELIYISSAGLRVLLFIHKAMIKKNGSFVLKNVSEDIMEIFNITGFTNILTVQ